jgi:uncharacterized protein
MKKIISIDGGGIRGIVSSYILMKIEEELGKPLHNYIDLVAGTSTGSIIAGAIAAGIPIKNVYALYLQEGPKIFNRDFKQKVKTCFGFVGSKYSKEQLNNSLENRFNDIKLGELKINFLATAYNMTEGRPRFFSSKFNQDYLLKEVVMASSSAPTYFKPTIIDGEEYVDGGLFSSNPAMASYAEIKHLYNSKAEDIFIFSVGNGQRVEGYLEVNKWNKFNWVNPLIDIMMSSDAGIAHYQLVKIYKSINKRDNYIRVNEVLPATISKHLDDVSEANIKSLINFAEFSYKMNEEKIKTLIKQLKEDGE